MTTTSKTILFFGTDDFSAVSLRELLAQGFTIGAVITKPDSHKGRGRQLSAPLVKQTALQHDIPVWQPAKVREIAEHVQALTAHSGEKPTGVLVSYGKIIPQTIIDLFEPGIINVHPSLLPKYRGPSPIESAILNGDIHTGVSIMQLSAAMDAGPVYSQVNVALTGTETAPQLEADLAQLGAQELCRVLPAIIDGSLQPVPQDDSAATYCQLLRKDDALLADTLLATLTTTQLERRIRAYLAFPKTKVNLSGHQVVITKAHVAPTTLSDPITTPPNSNLNSSQNSNSTTQPAGLFLTCANGGSVAIDELIGPSGKSMSAQAFINGYGRQER